MKKFSLILLIAVFTFGAFAFSACGNQDDKGSIGASQDAFFEEGDEGENEEDIDLTGEEGGELSGVDLLTATDAKYFNWEMYGSGSYVAYQVTGWSNVAEGRPTDIVFPMEYNGLPVIGIKQGAFRSDTSITSVKMGSKFLFIGKRAFTDCTRLSLVEIGPNTTKIAASAFRGCTSLTDITIPTRVRKVYPSAFRGCTSLANVTLSEETTAIMACAFMDCHALTSIYIPSSVTTIGSCAFMNCTSITSVTLPSSITTLNTDVFSGCTALTKFTSKVSNKAPKTSGSTVTYCFYVKVGAFYGCKKLTDLTIPADSSVSSTAFVGTPYEDAYKA